MATQKPVHAIVLDAGPILKNDPSISTLLAKSEQLFTSSSIVSEIKDLNARSRVETTLLPFLTIRDPNVKSIKVVTEFARKTGDLVVLSKADISILALAYEIECEKNGGDWRLRRVPGQKAINGPVPQKAESASQPDESETAHSPGVEPSNLKIQQGYDVLLDDVREAETATAPNVPSSSDPNDAVSTAMSALQNTATTPIIEHEATAEPTSAAQANTLAIESGSDTSDAEGWITPSNLKKHQVRDANAEIVPVNENRAMQVATITTDYAMQNVLLQMGLNLLSASIQQVRHIRTYILRCYACFEKVKDMTKQFCPRCGKPTLTRVSCSTNAKGDFRIHLKKNMQWNHRGDRFSIPKPTAGTASGKFGTGKGGGKGGWGQELILAEDQKEYVRAMQGESRRKEKNLMDEDYLPSILTGERGRAGGRPKVGAGRNVNSKKR